MRPLMEKSLQETDCCIVKTDTWFPQGSAHWGFLTTDFPPVTCDR